MSLPNSDSFDQLGGKKINYSQIEDPNTDVDAGQYSQMCFDVAMMTATSPRCWVRFTGGTSPVLVAHNSVWGNSAPVTPVIAHTSTGTYTITFPSTVNDGLGTPSSTITVNLRVAWDSVDGGLFTQSARAWVTAPNVISVKTYLSGASDDLSGITINVIGV